MVMLQKVWWKEYSQVHAEYFYFSPVAFPFLRIAGRLEYCYLYILCIFLILLHVLLQGDTY